MIIIEEFLFEKSDKKKRSRPKNQNWYIWPVVRLLRMVQDIRCSSYGSPSLEVRSLLLSRQSREGACNTLDLSLINNFLGNSGSNLHWGQTNSNRKIQDHRLSSFVSNLSNFNEQVFRVLMKGSPKIPESYLVERCNHLALPSYVTLKSFWHTHSPISDF